MEQSESIKELSTALSKAQGELENVSKSGKGNYGKYAELGPTLDKVRPITSRHGLAVVQLPVILEDGTTGLMTQLSHSTGEWIRATFPVRMQQQTPQGQGSAITYARRYSLSAVLGIAGDDDDGQVGSEGKNPEPSTKVPQPTAPKSPLTVSVAQKEELRKLMVEKNIDADHMTTFVQDTLGRSTVVTQNDYEKVKTALEKK